MAHTYTSNLIHCVFSTKERSNTIPPERKEQLWAYLFGIAKNEKLNLVAAGGTANHLHLLFALPPTLALSEAVKKLKGNSSRWMGPGFSWQEGFGAISVSPSQIPVIKNYIHNQAEHHKKRNFEDEFTALLKKCGIDYDPRFVFG
jgi:putative transposase